MKMSRVIASWAGAAASFALGGAAFAASTPSGNWSTGTMSKATPVASETCATAKASYHAALKAHPKSAALKDAKAKARAGVRVARAAKAALADRGAMIVARAATIAAASAAANGAMRPRRCPRSCPCWCRTRRASNHSRARSR